MAKATYKDAGVDLDIYRAIDGPIAATADRTYTPRVIPLEGGFAGLFQLDFANQLFARQYEDPVLVACTDGVGTKLKVAAAVGIHNTVGIDLVAMSVNDALCCGAEPLFFLDYVAMPQDDPGLLEADRRGDDRRLLEADVPCSAARRPSCPTSTPRAITTWPAFAWAWSRRQVIDGRAIVADDVVWAWRRPACTPTATAWPARWCSILPA